MKTGAAWVSLAAAILLVLAPLVAGCTSIPGPGSAERTPVIPVTAAQQETSAATAPATETPVAAVTRAPAMTNPPRVTVTPAVTAPSGNVSLACLAQGGTVVTPGSQCRGTWIGATDTFSCCYGTVVPVKGGEAPVTMPAFTLVVNVDDDLGSIIP